MKESNVILTPLPQADGQIKNRPAVILREMPPFGDMLVCGISTQLRQEVKGFDEVILATDPDFEQSNLLAPSLIRLGFLAILPRTRILGAIGNISRDRHHRLLEALSKHLPQNIPK